MGDFTLDEALEIGMNASLYAREQIIHGGTQLENNDLALIYAKSYRTLTGLWQETEGKKDFGIREMSYEIVKEKVSSDPLIDDRLPYYESIIFLSSKHRIGSCFELSLQALDHIVNKGPEDFNAELYQIGNGDHVFLVLNRDPDSDPKKPETWGDAVICDPWSNLVYPAAEYKSKLRNYYLGDDGKNYDEPFDPVDQKHFLEPHPENLNAQLIHHAREIQALPARNSQDFSDEVLQHPFSGETLPNETLQNKFTYELNYLKQTVEIYKERTEKDINRLLKKKDSDMSNKKRHVLEGKVADLNLALLDINEALKLNTKQYNNDSASAYSELSQKLRNVLKDTIDKMQFTDDEKTLLFTHTKKGVTSEMKFFDHKASTEKNLRKTAALIENRNKQK